MNHIDVFHDPAHARLRLLCDEYPGVAALVQEKTADLDEDPAALPPTAFADPVNRFFPIHSAKHAALSAAYAHVAVRQSVRVPVEVLDQIKTACEAYGVADTLLAAREKVASTINPDDCIFPERGLYPVRTPAEVKVAEARLNVERTKLGAAARVAAYGRLHEKAQRFGVKLGALAEKYTGQTATDADRLRDLLRARAAATPNETVKTACLALADAVHRDRAALAKRETQIKIAAAIEDLDERGGLIRHYDRDLPDPIETVFNAEKTAAGGIDFGEDSVPMTKLMSLDPSFYADALGDDFLPDITTGGQLDHAKLAEVLPTLPRDMKSSLRRALRSAGV